MDDRNVRGLDLCTESELNYIVTSQLEVDVLADVEKRRKIVVPINEMDKGSTTAHSNKGDVATASKPSDKGDTIADYKKGNVATCCIVSNQEHIYLTFCRRDGGTKNLKINHYWVCSAFQLEYEHADNMEAHFPVSDNPPCLSGIEQNSISNVRSEMQLESL